MSGVKQNVRSQTKCQNSDKMSVFEQKVSIWKKCQEQHKMSGIE